MESHNLGFVNEIFGAATIDEHYLLVVFNVALDFQSLYNRNTW